MAEIGLVASIIALAGTGAKLAMGLYTLADSIGSAGKEARQFASEISLFSQSLNAVSKSLDRKTDKNDRLVEIAQVVMKACESLLKDIRTQLQDLPRGQHTVRAYCARIKWVLRKPKLRGIRVSIESFKSTLILLVATMDSAEASYCDAPEYIKCVF
jgi:hypothetical protein